MNEIVPELAPEILGQLIPEHQATMLQIRREAEARLEEENNSDISSLVLHQTQSTTELSEGSASILIGVNMSEVRASPTLAVRTPKLTGAACS